MTGMPGAKPNLERNTIPLLPWPVIDQAAEFNTARALYLTVLISSRARMT